MAFVFLPLTVRAQANTPRWVCLESKRCDQAAGACAATSDFPAVHRANLTIKADAKPLASADTYIIGCISTDQAPGQLCTTGNAQLDISTVYKEDRVAMLNQRTGFVFDGLLGADGKVGVPNPVRSNTDSTLGHIEWADHMPASHEHKWMAMNYWDPNSVPDAGAGGQQQGTFSFENAEKNCVKISWDPYGRIFDATTLEPIAGSVVTLLVKRQDGSFTTVTANDVPGTAIINPQTTVEDGQFSFVVPPGDYKLQVVPAAVAAMSAVDASYTKAYYELYPLETGDVVHQTGAIQHRDIPVTTASTNTQPKLMEYFYETSGNGKATVHGRVSHPLTKLIASTIKVSTADPNSKTPYRPVGSYQTDKWGKFNIEIDQTNFEKTADYTEAFGQLELVKTDLRDTTPPPAARTPWQWFLARLADLTTTVFAQAKNTIINFEPIPQYLDGYAYDANGKPMANTRVGVYETFSNKPYVEVKTDANGHFVVTSQYLPNSTYEIRYTTPNGSTTKVTPSKFLAQNQKDNYQRKVDSFVYHDQKGAVVAQPGTTARAGGTGSSVSGSTKTGSGSKTIATNRGGSGRNGSATTGGGTTNVVGQTAGAANPAVVQTMLVLFLLVLLLGGVGVGAFMYMKHKPTQMM